MTLNRILRSLRRNLVPALVVGAVLGLLTTGASLLLAKPTYTANNLVLFQVADMDKVPDPSAATDYATTLASSYTAMITQPVIVQPLAKELGTEPELVQAGITVVPPRNNLVATISYESEDEAEATRVVTLAGRQLQDTVDQTTDKVGNQPRIQVTRQAINTMQTPGTGRSLFGSLLKGAVVGLMTVLAWLLFRALLDTRVRDTADLHEVADSSVLAHLREPQDAASLARAVPFLGLGTPATLALTSSLHREATGPAVVATARSLAAEPGARVLLVDADLRHGSASRELGLQGPGLSELLSGRGSLAELVQHDGQLAVLGSGTLPPNPAELLAGPRLAEALATAGQRFDLVVLNAPGLLEHSDAALAAGPATGTVLLAGARQVSQSQLRESIDLLDTVGARLQGLVLSEGADQTPRR